MLLLGNIRQNDICSWHELYYIIFTDFFSSTFINWSNGSINPNTFAGLWGRCKKNYLPKEEGREGGDKKHAQGAHGGQGSNLGPAAC